MRTPSNMSAKRAPVDGVLILVGKALPFSIYRSGTESLLLAQGQVVGTEGMREMLIREGCVEAGSVGAVARTLDEPEEELPKKSLLQEYEPELEIAAKQARVAVRLSRIQGGDSYVCWLLGADESYGLMFTAPRRSDNELLSVLEGDTWVFHMMHTTAAIKFVGTIRKTLFKPAPLLYVVPSRVEMRQIRGSPRVATSLRGTIDLGNGPIQLLISDLSVGGACLVAERGKHDIKAGKSGTLCFQLNLLGQSYPFKTEATITSVKEALTERHAGLLTAGARIEAQSQVDKLVLHGFVHERMALSFDATWRVLLASQ
jgi:PilZ domain